MPAEKKRKMNIQNYIRVIQTEDRAEKRKEDEKDTRELKKMKKIRKETETEMKNTYTELEEENDEESRWEDPETEIQRWEKMLEER